MPGQGKPIFLPVEKAIFFTARKIKIKGILQQFIFHVSVHSFNKYLLRDYYVSGIVSGTKDIAVNKRPLPSWSVYLGEIGDKKLYFKRYIVY